jgi:ABC-type glycerol-3-phosphate transport system substrate-binding protein
MKRPLAALLATAAVAACAVAGAARVSAQPQSSKATTLQLWLGGVLTTSTPGTPYRKFVDTLIKRFKQQNPGINVQITLLPPNNEQLAAKVQSAFAAHKVPDLMMLYSGAYTTAYAKGLLRLNTYVTPQFYNSLSNWDLSCTNLACNGGKGEIIGVPMDYGPFVLFYNKQLFKQAGVTQPPTTYQGPNGLLAVCRKLKAKGILPMAYGDRDGYTTDNMVLENYPSYLSGADVQKILGKQLKFADPKVVQPLSWVVKLHQQGCVSPDATTHEQIDATNAFTTGKAAMVEMYSGLVSSFEKGLGVANIGVTPIPQSGPHKGGIAASSLDNWVIPKDSKYPELAFKFIKIASDASAGDLVAGLVASAPANKVAARRIKDPIVRWIAAKAAKPALPLLDSVLENKVTFYYYKNLQLAFAGKETPLQAMQKVDQAYAALHP